MISTPEKPSQVSMPFNVFEVPIVTDSLSKDPTLMPMRMQIPSLRPIKT